MQRFVDATRAAVGSGNWYAALALALTIPDICGRLETPAMGSQARYVGWYDRYLLRKYQHPVGPSRTLHTFLCGADCYALRCAYLHQGEFGIEDQRAQQALLNFHFTPPQPGMFIHNNQMDNVLQLQVDVFCEDVCVGAARWLEAVSADADIQARLARLATIG
jgi:hypothetical protein